MQIHSIKEKTHTHREEGSGNIINPYGRLQPDTVTTLIFNSSRLQDQLFKKKIPPVGPAQGEIEGR